MEEIWTRALADLRDRTDRPAFESWIAPIGFAGGDDLGIDLSVPDSFFRDHVRSHHYDAICSSVADAADRPLQVRLLIADPSLMTSDLGSAPAEPGRGRGDPGGNPAAGAQASLPLSGPSGPPAGAAAPRGRHVGLMPSLDFSRFVVGEANQLAHGAALSVAESDRATFNPLFLHGGVGVGKTHLLQAIGNELARRNPSKRILYVAAASFIEEFITAMASGKRSARGVLRERYRNVDLLLVDDVQFLQGKDKTQEEFFHTFNALQQSGSQIVLSSDRYPAELASFQERLRNRFAWGLVAEIAPPDRQTRVAILERKAKEMALDADPEVLRYIADHLRSNVRELEGALNKLQLHARISRRPVDMSLARTALGPVMNQHGQRLTIGHIQKVACDYFGLRMTDLKGARRHRAVVVPRMIAMYLARKRLQASYPELGRAFGGRDHTTAMNACKRVRFMLGSDENVQRDVAAIEDQLGR